MGTITVTNARKNLFKIVEDVNFSSEPVEISSKSGAVVMISKDDWEALQETLYLTSIPGMRKSLVEASKESLEDCVDEADLKW